MAKNQTLKNIDKLSWGELKRHLSIRVHDDSRDLSEIKLALNSLERKGANKKIVSALHKLRDELFFLHEDFYSFRSRKTAPSRAEIDRFVLSYSGRLKLFEIRAISRLKNLKPVIDKIKNRSLRTSLIYEAKRLGFMARYNATSSFFFFHSKLKLRKQSLKRVVAAYVNKGVVDRAGNPVKVLVRGRDATAFFDKRLLTSSLANLLTDAINHTPGKVLYLTIGLGKDMASLSVTSKGRKLTPQQIKKIGLVRFTRSGDPKRGFGKISVRMNTEKQSGKFVVGNSNIGPRLTIKLPRLRQRQIA